MNDPISSTYEYLLAHYGPLMTFKHLAEVLHSTPNGLRMAIARKQYPMAIALEKAKRRVGRRVYFEAGRVAEVIDQGFTGTEGRQSPLEHYFSRTPGQSDSDAALRRHLSRRNFTQKS